MNIKYKDILLNVLLIAFAVLAFKKLMKLKDYAHKVKRSAQVQSVKTSTEKEQANTKKLFDTLFNSADIHLQQLANCAGQQRQELQVYLFEQINGLAEEIDSAKSVYYKEKSPALFLLGPLGAPAQKVKERAIKKRLLVVEQKIEELFELCQDDQRTP